MRKWTDNEIEFLKHSLSVMPISTIAHLLNRTERAVRLFCYRNEFSTRPVLKCPIMKLIIETKFGNIKYFRPDRTWFDAVGIGQKRFSELKHGYKQPTSEEIQKVMIALRMSPEERDSYMGALQLTLNFSSNNEEKK